MSTRYGGIVLKNFSPEDSRLNSFGPLLRYLTY